MKPCPYCAEQIMEEAKKCKYCGEILDPAMRAQQAGAQGMAAMGPERSMGFGEAISICFKKYADFSGRARRAEYWYWFLLSFLIGMAFNVGSVAVTPEIMYGGWLWSLATLIPGLAVAVRRCHDIGKSGWSILLFIIPCVGLILWLMWFCQDGNPGPNQYGPDPKRDPAPRM